MGRLFFYPKERRNMKRKILVTAAVLSAVLLFSASLPVISAEEAGTVLQKEEKLTEQVTAEEEGPASSLTGEVSHTAQWEQNRISANLYFEEKGEREQERSRDTFWSGEKFVLTAQAEGETLPSSVKVSLEGTDYSAELTGRNGVYRGALFDENMLFQWGQRKAESLSFVFSAVIDGKRLAVRKEIVIDDRQPYWLLHRKR